ncbi:MAG: rod shape-determining protein MreD [Bacteroidetes bacterium]|nr:rod shape-determining protein MreD [Bacteroidota bacterium]
MTLKFTISNLVLFIVAFLLQVMVFNNVNVYGLGFPMIYMLPILFIPVMQPAWLVLTAAFLCGLSVDFFTDTGGMHAAATTFMAFARMFVLNRMQPQAGYGKEDSPGIRRFGFQWVLIYLLLLVVFHHLFYFLVEDGGFSRFGHVLLKSSVSTLFSVLLIMIMNLFIFRR